MTTPAPNTQNPGVKFEIPAIPEEFGQDGGEFIRRYDALADEIDDDMVKGLKEQLDGLLIFAGLFAGVNSAFLALTLPLMSPDPADDINALLRENNAILLQLALGRNDSLPSAQALPSETFSPAGKVLTVNVLFSVSLTLALISSFMAVLGRQWLVYYRKRSGGGPDRQRWEQLKRFIGAERWGLEWALDDFLPSMLQIGLIIFCISLTIYLSTLHPTLSSVVGAFMCAGLAIFIITAPLATWDKFCPFQSPLSHLISRFIALATGLITCLAAALDSGARWQWGSAALGWAVGRLAAARLEPGRLEPGRLAPGHLAPGREATARDVAALDVAALVEMVAKVVPSPFWLLTECLSLLIVPILIPILIAMDLFVMVQWLFRRIFRNYFVAQSGISWQRVWEDLNVIPRIMYPLTAILALLARGKRQEEDPGELQIFAIKRAICTSDDALTLLHGVSNILAISDSHLLEILAADDEFTTRLSELWRGSYSRTLQLRGRDQLELATRIQCLYRAALAHVLLSFSKAIDWDHRERLYNLILPSEKGSEEQRMLPPSDLVQNVHSNMINAYLSCISFDWAFDYRKLPGVNSLPPPSSMDVLLNPTWRCISVVLRVIVGGPKAGSRSYEKRNVMNSLHTAHLGLVLFREDV
ncbi:hypothetical protein FRC04_007823 [Tulasnella sp. 424]|nr:hypothetical protein FRC04_007823 [Tulasnella sp. 424]